MNFYTVNVKLHTLHTIREGTRTNAIIASNNLNKIKIGSDWHKVFVSASDAIACKTMLDLHGTGE